MKTTIETIGGKKYTTITRKVGVSVLYVFETQLGVNEYFCIDTDEHIATALPPLPRHPKPEHAKLLYRYASEGLDVCGKHYSGIEHGTIDVISSVLDQYEIKITHCVDEAGNRVDVAIEEAV